MAEKDMTEKTLESYNDVFADIVNVSKIDFPVNFWTSILLKFTCAVHGFMLL